MLSASEFSVGCLADATGLCLFLPRTKYEHMCLVTSVSGTAMAICLDGNRSFCSLPCANNTAWKGVIVPGVSIEVDQSTLFDADGGYPPFGTMIRKTTELALVAKDDYASYARSVHYPVASDLPASREDMAAGFTRWQVVLWRGDERRVLATVETKEKPAD